jgi:hypothetical protein
MLFSIIITYFSKSLFKYSYAARQKVEPTFYQYSQRESLLIPFQHLYFGRVAIARNAYQYYYDIELETPGLSLSAYYLCLKPSSIMPPVTTITIMIAKPITVLFEPGILPFEGKGKLYNHPNLPGKYPCYFIA